MTFIRAIWDELARPSTLPPGPLHGAYERAVIGMAHMVIGAALASLVAPEWASGAATIKSGIGAMEGDNCIIEYVRSPSPPDGWHDRNGYLNRQAVEAFLHDPQDGQVMRFTNWF